MPDAWLRSKLMWGAAGALVLLLVLLLRLALGAQGPRALAPPPLPPESGRAQADPLVGRWACIKSVGLLGEGQLDLRLRFGSDRSLSVEVATTNGLGSSAQGCAAGRGTWERRGAHQLFLSVETLTLDFEALGSAKRPKRVKKWLKKLVSLVEVGHRELVLADLFRSGQEVFTRLPDY